jgi:hypothetical protein
MAVALITLPDNAWERSKAAIFKAKVEALTSQP